MTEEKEKAKSTKGISRRRFIAGTVGGVVVGAAAGAVAGSLGFPKTITAQPWLPSTWDYTADVVVVGTGLSALSTAITAHDAGADVLVLEKLDQAHEGGNSKVSGNLFWAPADLTLGATYIKALEVGQLTDDTIINALAAGLQENLSVIKGMGLSYAPSGLCSPEFTFLPGSSTVTMYGVVINGKTMIGGGHLYAAYRDAVSSRNINIMYSTPVTGLIQNGDTKEVLGVTALTGGTVSSAGLPTGGNTINIRANKAVVLACGGFEFNFDMQNQSQFGFPIYGEGTPGNTGDGIQMAQKAGADLWHMNMPSGGSYGALVVPDFPYPIPLGSPAGNSYIWSDKLGNRWLSETGPAWAGLGTFGAHGWGIKEYFLQFDGSKGVYPRLPSWLIFDEAARVKGGLVTNALTNAQSAFYGWYSGYTWSSDNSAEIAKGWITKADSIADLAASIASDTDDLNPMGQPLMTADALQATITRFNGFATTGTDLDFGRPAASMAPFGAGPFYAVKFWPIMVNTNGGPRRNINCQIVDPSSNPIPRLYGVGECGSFWGWLYNGGGNIGECMWTGRVAGKNASAETPWT